nr:NAD-dependent epimerase/dehydratase family protein [Thioalkalivibrio versutus]
MKVLITGSAGFFGSAPCLRLLGRDDEVIGVAELTRIIGDFMENA